MSREGGRVPIGISLSDVELSGYEARCSCENNADA
jgi:hypothetical protein